MDKKSKGKKARKATKATKAKQTLTNVDAQFYELELQSLRKKLATARSHIKTLEEENFNLQAACANQEVLPSKASGILQTPFTTTEISEMNNSLNQLAEQHKKHILQYTEHIKDMEDKYRAMQTQLISEIKILTSQLNILKVHRADRDNMFKQLEEIERNANEKYEAMKEQLRTIEAKMLTDQREMKSEVADILSKLYGDLIYYMQLQQVSYVKQLLRNNLALTRELHQQMETIFAKNKMYYNIKLQTQKITEDNKYLNNLKVSLISNCKNKMQIIQSLVSSYERLRLEYLEAVKYRQLYEKLKNRNQDMNQEQIELRESYIQLRKATANLKAENNEIKEMNKNFETQIEQLTTYLNRIRKAVLEYVSIRRLEDSSSNYSSRQNLICILENILCGFETVERNYPVVSEASSLDIYEPGMIGLMRIRQKEPSFMDLVKSPDNVILKKKHRYSSEKMASMQKSKQGELIIPEERQIENNVIVDIETDSTLYTSSSSVAKDKVVKFNEVEETEAEEESDQDNNEFDLSHAESDEAAANDQEFTGELAKQGSTTDNLETVNRTKDNNNNNGNLPTST